MVSFHNAVITQFVFLCCFKAPLLPQDPATYCSGPHHLFSSLTSFSPPIIYHSSHFCISCKQQFCLQDLGGSCHRVSSVVLCSSPPLDQQPTHMGALIVFRPIIAAKTESEFTRGLIAYAQIIAQLMQYHENTSQLIYNQQFKQVAGGMITPWRKVNTDSYCMSATVHAPRTDSTCLKCSAHSARAMVTSLLSDLSGPGKEFSEKAYQAAPSRLLLKGNLCHWTISVEA